MDSDSKKKSPYGAAMRGDWESMIDYYHSNFSDLLLPVTQSMDTAFHIAVCSQKEQPLKDLLSILPSTGDSEEEENPFETIVVQNLLMRQNKYGNNVLHEATIYGNFEAVKLLAERCPGLVSIANKFGETPLFTAAEFSGGEIVKFFLSSPLLSHEIVDNVGGCRRLKEIHRHRSLQNLSILNAAIIGQNFEAALILLQLDESLHSDPKDTSALQLLANMPTVFESGYPMDLHKRIIYCWLPVIRRHKLKLPKETSVNQASQGSADPESGLIRRNRKESKMTSVRSCSKFFARGYWVPAWLQRIWDEKRKHVFALRLAEMLIKKDISWDPVETIDDKRMRVGFVSTSQVTGAQEEKKEASGKDDNEGTSGIPIQSSDESDYTESEEVQNDKGIIFKGKEIIILQSRRTKKPLSTKKYENPLFTATRHGVEEIVRGIIEQHPQAIEHFDDMGRSILDMAVMHRKREIFSLVKQMKIPLARLHRVVDKKGNTLLHHVADMTQYSGGTKPGPALQLQEELQWFERVSKVIPSHYVSLRNKKGKTARELFKKNHQEQLKNAQKWIKETTQSCSTVAALVATVVFAAAYTVPGGSDDEGTPNFINSPYFLVFTVSDVISLASSLTSLVVFLSLLTSPFELEDFRVSLPRKLIIGFTFLFFSVMTTMLSFGATILILIQSERKLTTLLLSIAAFLPVLVFAIMQFRLYITFMGSTFKVLKINWKSLPSFPVPRLPWRGKLD